MKQEDMLYDVWWQNRSEGEQKMEEQHNQSWREVISLIQEQDLSTFSILDFGCNQGGFLRLLYQARPFREGVGIDLAQQSIAVANARKGDMPLNYLATTTFEQFAGKFDLAVSLAVIYLIKDLKNHARKIRQALKPGGVYYATYTDYANNASLPHFREWINRNSLLEANVHTLDHIAETFITEGFEVQLQRRIPQGFIKLSALEEGFLTIADRMQARYDQSYIFRFVVTPKKST